VLISVDKAFSIMDLISSGTHTTGDVVDLVRQVKPKRNPDRPPRRRFRHRFRPRIRIPFRGKRSVRAKRSARPLRFIPSRVIPSRGECQAGPGNLAAPRVLPNHPASKHEENRIKYQSWASRCLQEIAENLATRMRFKRSVRSKRSGRGRGRGSPRGRGQGSSRGRGSPRQGSSGGRGSPRQGSSGGRAQGSSSGRGQGTSGGYTRGRFRVSPVQDPLRARSRSPLRTEETRPVPRPIRPSQMGRPRVVNREGSHSPRTQLGPVGTTGEDVNRGLPRKFSLDFD
jgi:hypothetical protein